MGTLSVQAAHWCMLGLQEGYLVSIHTAWCVHAKAVFLNDFPLPLSTLVDFIFVIRHRSSLHIKQPKQYCCSHVLRPNLQGQLDWRPSVSQMLEVQLLSSGKPDN